MVILSIIAAIRMIFWIKKVKNMSQDRYLVELRKSQKNIPFVYLILGIAAITIRYLKEYYILMTAGVISVIVGFYHFIKQKGSSKK